jgi:hypothetical protein
MVSGEGKRRKAAIFFVIGREKIVPSWEKLGKTLSVNKGCFLVRFHLPPKNFTSNRTYPKFGIDRTELKSMQAQFFFLVCLSPLSLSSSLGRAKNYRYQQYFVPLEINKVLFHSTPIAFFITQIESP